MSSIQPGKHITTSENQLLELQTCTQHMAGTLVRRSRRKGVSDYLYKILFFFCIKFLKFYCLYLEFILETWAESINGDQSVKGLPGAKDFGRV